MVSVPVACWSLSRREHIQEEAEEEYPLEEDEDTVNMSLKAAIENPENLGYGLRSWKIRQFQQDKTNLSGHWSY